MIVANYQQVFVTDYCCLFVCVCDLFYCVLTISISTCFCNLVRIYGRRMNGLTGGGIQGIIYPFVLDSKLLIVSSQLLEMNCHYI
jgi:hypothetical protein